jgi:hypothetical protein
MAFVRARNLLAEPDHQRDAPGIPRIDAGSPIAAKPLGTAVRQHCRRQPQRTEAGAWQSAAARAEALTGRRPYGTDKRANAIRDGDTADQKREMNCTGLAAFAVTMVY